MSTTYCGLSIIQIIICRIDDQKRSRTDRKNPDQMQTQDGQTEHRKRDGVGVYLKSQNRLTKPHK